jgi:LysR family transcriptional regulator (chromosome initiation inhibitor)
MTILDATALECLAAIVEEGGFERAAKRLNITQSAVSQRLRTLESATGTVLIVRSRPIRPTPAGQLLIKHTKMHRLLRADLDRDLKELAPNDARGPGSDDRISIAINADSIATWALPALSGLAQDGVPLEIIADDQDFTQDWLREGQVLGCVTTLSQTLRGCRQASLGVMRYVAVASPDFAQRHCAGGLNRTNFHKLPFVAFNRKDDMQTEFVCNALGLSAVSLRQSFVPSSQGQLQAAIAGWGIAVIPELLALPALADGRLTNLAPAKPLAINLYWHCWNLESALLAAISKALVLGAQQALAPAPGT